MPSATPPFTELSSQMTGRVVTASDNDWDAARQVFNLAADLRPAAVVLPDDVDDVVAAVRYAGSNGLRVAPQATGHNGTPLGSLEDTLLVDVRGLQEVSIDGAARHVRVGGGVKWDHVVPQLSELGLGALHGSSPDVGIAGYSLGGGMGWLSRKHGLQANSVTAIELVTADGSTKRVDAEQEPDLFWALRGGNGNFGVATAIEFTVYPVDELYAGVMFFPFERTHEVLETWTELLPTLPEEMMTWARLMQFPDAPEVPEPVRGRSFALIFGVFLGGEREGGGLLGPVRDMGPAMDTFAAVSPVALGDLAMDPRDPLPHVSTTALLSDLPGAGIDELLAAAGPGSGSPLVMVELRQLDGAIGRAAPGAGARANLPGSLSMHAIGVSGDEASAATATAYLESVARAVLPYRVGAYPSFVEVPADASAFFDPDTWARLRQVKALHDPDDLFKGNHHIPPA
jgi:FAD binding domain